MIESIVLRIALAIAIAGFAGHAVAQDSAAPAASEKRAAGQGLLRLLPDDSVTSHSIETAQGKLDYTATAGMLGFFDQSGVRSADVFYTAYVAKSAGPTRPVTFVFNGGPGAASAFLHLGLVGPRILDFGPQPHDAARAKLIDNPDTWLRFTDLVMIDPIGTGWSRTAKPEDAKQYWGIKSDADSMVKAVALYIAKNNRAASPKYLLGESYGGLRAARTARALHLDQGIVVSGIVMVAPLLEGWLTFGDDASALRAALRFPSLAAAELERKGLFSAEKLAEAETFAMNGYLTTLAGPPPKGEAAKAFYDKVAALTGLPLEEVSRARGFVTDSYVKTLREGKVVSRYDAGFAVDDPFPEQRAGHSPDPVLDGISRTYGGAMASYARNELGFKTEMTYQLLNGEVTRRWDWGNGRAQVSAEADLRVLLSFTPSFRLLIAHGLADMVTPHAMTRYVVEHLPPFDPPSRVALKNYRGGHMFYIDAASRFAFSTDAATFYRGEE